MYVIAGLGNPGKAYEKTRHNMGFQVLDRLAEEHDIRIRKLKSRALIGEGFISGQKVLLVKPQTYMNNSGESLGEILRYYHLQPEQLLVIYDDMDLQTGTIRIRKKGGPGSHNGMKSVISHVHSQEFPRIRVGIGSSGQEDWKDFVLHEVSSKDAGLLSEAIDNASRAVAVILDQGIDIAMNRFNVRAE